VKRSRSLLVVLAAFVVAAPAQAAKPNPFGIAVVRFEKGTSAAEMNAAVTKSGADVVNDLSAVNALAVAPTASDFAARIRKNARVTTVFTEPLFHPPADHDMDGASGSGWNPVFGPSTSPDPWHDASSFLGVTNPQGILQWDDARMNVASAWTRTRGDRSIRVAVIDTGVEQSHRELKDNVVATRSFIPCDSLTREFGAAIVKQFGLRDCSSTDKEGHGTWVASRIAGAVNGFASNGVAPNVQVASYKVLAANFGGLPDWILSGLIAACSDNVDLVNMSIVGYFDPTDPSGAQTYLLFNDVVQYCRDRGVTVFASAGNEHVRIDRVSTTVGGRALNGVGRVSTGSDGIAQTRPGDPADDLRGLLEAPGGVPGVVDVAATNNGNVAGPAADPFTRGVHVGARDQLAYYSSYGPRIDLAAPGGARRFNVPGWDGGDGNFLYGGFGSLGALAASGSICTDPAESSLFNFACFKVQGSGFGWLQGTSMSSPNAVGVAALTLSAKPALRRNPAALVARLQSTARKTMTNYTGPSDPANTATSFDGRRCPTGYCHLDTSRAIGFSDAYGAGLVDAGVATR
jgi:lantibiotic leader peptide-processing serine protease